MGITVTWDNPEKTVIYTHFEQPWTWADFEVHVQQMRDMAASAPHAIHSIIDIREFGLPPTALAKIRQTMAALSPLFSSITVVGAKPVDQSLGRVAQKTTRAAQNTEIRFVTSLEEARAQFVKAK